MQELINVGLAFLEGLALIVSPCILPVLPILLSASLTGSRRRPFGIIVGFVCTFALFTFFSRALVTHLGLNLNWLRYASYVLLLFFGLVMLSTYLSDKFSALTSVFAQAGAKFSSKTGQEGFSSGVVIGSLVGLIWTPCAGPILAAVIVQSVLQQSNTGGFLTILSFGFGAGVPMLFIAIFGRGLMNKLGFFKTYSHGVRKFLGIVIIGAVAYLAISENTSLSVIKPSATATENKALSLTKGLEKSYPAPDFTGISAWINSQPLHINDLKGKVVLVDFWTYSCINCIRTLPYIKDWYAKYHDKGFEIIGVHTPEFEFEKELTNVQLAVTKFAILYPVALDGAFSTWKGYNNSYWPAHYLIDKAGAVVYTHFGEGEYDVTENNIRFLLNIDEPKAPNAKTEEKASGRRETPETYLGFERAESFSSPEAVQQGKAAKYSFPKTLDIDNWALQGHWTIEGQRIVAKEANAVLKLNFEASKVFVVMGNNTGKPIHAKLLLNGEALFSIEVKEHRLYETVALPQHGTGILQIVTSAPGLEIYAFTFDG